MTSRRSAAPMSAVRSATVLATVCLAAPVIAAPLLIGGVLGWSLALLSGLAAMALLVTLTSSRHERLLTVPVIALLLACAWAVLQALRLDCGLVERLTPALAALQRETFELVQSAQAGCSISYDPAATQRLVVQDLATVCVLVASLAIARRGRGEWIAKLLALSSTVFLVVASLHWLLDAKAVFGFYVPREAQPAVLTPLLNSNHLAAFISFGAPFLLWLARGQEPSGVRVLSASLLLLSGVMVGLSGSRSGAASFTFALVASLLWHRGKRSKRTGSTGSPYLALALSGVSIVAGVGLVLRSSQDYTKLDQIRHALRFAFEGPWVGVGRGAFSAAFVEAFGTRTRSVYAENLVAEYIAQYGWVVAFALGIVVAGSLLVRIPLLNRNSERACLIALGTLALHDLADFSLQIPGLAFPAAAAAGVVLAKQRVVHAGVSLHPGRTAPTWQRLVRQQGAPFGIAVATLLATLFLGPSFDARATENYVAELSASRARGDESTFRATLEDALRDHPVEPAVTLIAAAQAVDRDAPDAPRWLNRAMSLAPGWLGPHSEAARWLLQRGRVPQAALELQLASELDLAQGAAMTCELVSRYRYPALVFGAAPNDERRDAFLSAAVACLRLWDPLQVAIDEHTTPQGDPDAILRRAGWLRNQDQWGKAEALLREAYRHKPTAGLLVALGETLIGEGRVEDALALAIQGRSRDYDAAVALQARALTALGRRDDMRKLVDEIQRRNYTYPNKRADALELLGELEERLGERQRALAAYERAIWLRSTPTLLMRYASLAEKTGDFTNARQAYQRLCEGPPPNAEACEHVAELPAKMLGQFGAKTEPSTGTGVRNP